MTDVRMIPSARAMERARAIWPGLTIQSLAAALDAAVMEMRDRAVGAESMLADAVKDVAALRELAVITADLRDLATAKLMQVDDHFVGAWDHKDEMQLGRCIEMAHLLLAETAPKGDRHAK